MCIIVAKNKDVKLPSDDILETCFLRNSDGAGFMYVNKGKVIIDKGYMTYKAFKKHYDKLCKKYHNFEKKSLVIHFRIGTDGSNTPKNTHPFPVTNSYKDMQKAYFKTDLGLAHNGIISNYRPTKKDGDISDTMKFTREYIYELKNVCKNFYKNEYLFKTIDYISNGKVVLLDKDDNLYFSGYFITDNGIKYSNSTYKKYEYKPIYSDTHYHNNNSQSKVWNHTYEPAKATASKVANTTEKTSVSETSTKVNDRIVPVKTGANILTEYGKIIKITKETGYYYDTFNCNLYHKENDGGYKVIFNDVTIWYDEGEK